MNFEQSLSAGCMQCLGYQPRVWAGGFICTPRLSMSVNPLPAPQKNSGDYENYKGYRESRISGHSRVSRCKSRERNQLV